MFLPFSPLLFDLLLLFQFLGDSRLAKRLVLRSLVCVDVQSGLEHRVAAHTRHHIASQLKTRSPHQHTDTDSTRTRAYAETRDIMNNAMTV